MTRLNLLMLLGAASVWAATPDYLPLEVGNQWMLESTSPGARPLNIEVLRSRVQGGHTYFLVSGYAPGQRWLRRGDDGTVFALDQNGGEEKLAVLAASAAEYATALSGCEQSARPLAPTAPHHGPNFDFADSLTVAYQPLGCRDVGILNEAYAPNVGPVRRSITTIAGEIAYDLVYARVHGTPIIGKSREIVLYYDFNTGSKGWLPGFTDYSLRTADLQRIAELRPLPDEVDPNRSGLFIQSMNRSDDVFMFLKKQISSEVGIEANQAYRIAFEIRMSSDAPTGCVGIGGSPGEAVYLKAGAAVDEPVASLDGSGEIRLSADKGQQALGGRDAGVVGTIANGRQCDGVSWPFVSMKREYTHSYPVRTDDRGSLWLLAGTDSGYEGLTGLYFESIAVRISPVASARFRNRRVYGRVSADGAAAGPIPFTRTPTSMPWRTLWVTTQ